MNYYNSTKINEEDKLIMHFMFGEKMILRNGYPAVTSVTACAWTECPDDEMTLDIAQVTCQHCLKRT